MTDARLKVYIAGRYPKLKELAEEAKKYVTEGISVTSSWLDDNEVGMSFEDIAIQDLKDVDDADVLVLYTEPYGTPVPGGGRFVEMGYALGKGKQVVLVGPLENVFHWHPLITSFPNTYTAIRYLKVNL